MSDDSTTIQQLRQACAASAAAAPSEAGAWSRLEASRRRGALTTRVTVGLAFAAILLAAVALPALLGRGRPLPVAPAGAPGTTWPAATSVPPATEAPSGRPVQTQAPEQVAPTTAPGHGPGLGDDNDVLPAGPVLDVASGTTAGHGWVMQLFENQQGWLCTRWGRSGPGSCSSGGDASSAINPLDDGTPGSQPYGTQIEGLLPRDAVRVELAIRGAAPLRLATKGGARYGQAAYATVREGHAIVTRITAYDAKGKVVLDDRDPFNTPWS
jgi:hypothetical protein